MLSIALLKTSECSAERPSSTVAYVHRKRTIRWWLEGVWELGDPTQPTESPTVLVLQRHIPQPPRVPEIYEKEDVLSVAQQEQVRRCQSLLFPKFMKKAISWTISSWFRILKNSVT